MPDLFSHAEEQARRMHRGVETSQEAAERIAPQAGTDSMMALRIIGAGVPMGQGATYKDVNRIMGKDAQPRVSCLESDGYIEPLRDGPGSLVKRERCRVMVLTPAGRQALE